MFAGTPPTMLELRLEALTDETTTRTTSKRERNFIVCEKKVLKEEVVVFQAIVKNE